jgi:hypothetical protein
MRRLIHDYFELSYAQYLALPRSVLQSMPQDWQYRLVRLLDELDDKYEWRREGTFVNFRNSSGRWMVDELGDYDRGRLHLFPAQVSEITKRHNLKYETPIWRKLMQDNKKKKAQV